MVSNMMVSQNGGPTQAINATLVGIIEQAQKEEEIGKILVGKYGVRGFRDGLLIDVTNISPLHLMEIAQTPSAAAGSIRDKPDEDYCIKILEVAIANNVGYLFIIGGNDSADKAKMINDFSNDRGYAIRVWHIPKTVDNDLLRNDHSIGYGSAAKTVATMAAGNSLDNMAIPGIKIDVTMGRHAGFLTASSQLLMAEPGRYGPHGVFVPEDGELKWENFLGFVENTYTKEGRVHVVVSEGCTNEDIEAVLKGEVDAHGNKQLSGSGALADYLAARIKEYMGKSVKTKLRIRGDTYGYVQRSMPMLASEVDIREARRVGRFAVRQAVKRGDDKSVLITAVRDPRYRMTPKVIELAAVAKDSTEMPPGYVDNHVVTPAFIEYAKPLIGRNLPTFRTLI